jgi:site-specific DNA-cytosine methylase
MIVAFTAKAAGVSARRIWSCLAQGFPDDFTYVPYRRRNWTPDGPRYKALGNSMAVNAMGWIGERINACLDRLEWLDLS